MGMGMVNFMNKKEKTPKYIIALTACLTAISCGASDKEALRQDNIALEQEVTTLKTAIAREQALCAQSIASYEEHSQTCWRAVQQAREAFCPEDVVSFRRYEVVTRFDAGDLVPCGPGLKVGTTRIESERVFLQYKNTGTGETHFSDPLYFAGKFRDRGALYIGDTILRVHICTTERCELSCMVPEEQRAFCD